jgi:hypothetical protein
MPLVLSASPVGMGHQHIQGRRYRGGQNVSTPRVGHASGGSLTTDVYTHSEWEQNVEVAQLAGQATEKAVNSVSLTANQKGLPILAKPETPVAA